MGSYIYFVYLKYFYGAARENLGRCTCWSAVTTLCRFECGMAEVCTVPSAIVLVQRPARGWR